MIIKFEVRVVINFTKLFAVNAQLDKAVVAQHAKPAPIEDADILIPISQRVPAALTVPSCVRVHVAAVRAPHAFNAALIAAQRFFGKWPAVHTAQHACKDTVCEHLYIPRTVGVFYMKWTI